MNFHTKTKKIKIKNFRKFKWQKKLQAKLEQL